MTVLHIYQATLSTGSSSIMFNFSAADATAAQNQLDSWVAGASSFLIEDADANPIASMDTDVITSSTTTQLGDDAHTDAIHVEDDRVRIVT